MSTRWFRFYDSALDDPKVQRLPATLFKTWVNLLCVASRSGGMLPSLTDLAWTLRMDEEALSEQFGKLIEAGLIDECEGGMSPHNWTDRQYQSDTSAERMRKHRAAKKVQNSDGEGPGDGGGTLAQVGDVTGDERGDVTVTLQKRKEQIQIQNREDEDTADAGHHRVYAFEAGIIRLVETDLARWVKAFPAISVEAELYSLADWAGRPENRAKWFNAVAGALAKKNRDAIDRKAKVEAEVTIGAQKSARDDFLRRGLI